MRQKQLNEHYFWLKEELALREEWDWLTRLIEELYQRRELTRMRVNEAASNRLRLERKLCPITICKPKTEPRKRTQTKSKEESVQDLIHAIEGMNKSEKERLLKALERE